MYKIFRNIEELQADGGITEGSIVRTLGYYSPEDGGGAEYIVKKTNVPEDMGSVISLQHNLQAHLIVHNSIHYQIFGTKSDGIFDDGAAIKKAHAYANNKQLPVVNPAGEFWIKATNGIEVKTNVDWGQTVFHMDESFNDPQKSRFQVTGVSNPESSIHFDQSQLAQILPRLKKGSCLIPEFKDFANHLAFVRDEHCRVGHRTGDIRKSWAMEDFFYIEEHGRILGELTWNFENVTHIEMVPCDFSYLTIQGGTFYLSGNNNGDDGTYKWCGIQIFRSRTIIKNQFVGLEPGNKDTAMDPRRGFYAFHKSFDLTLENVRMIPFEKNRGESATSVPHGTYGIYGNRVLNLVLRNVTAEGGPTHWGVIGTNLMKNFKVDSCRLNRIDVHFHCYNLHVRDSEIGDKGITVTGGGNLFVENTKFFGNTLLEFRRDYGSRWEGDVRIQHCQMIAASPSAFKAILSFNHADKNYGYNLFYGRTVRVEDVMIDFTSAQDEEAEILLLSHPALTNAGGQWIHFPSKLIFRDIVVIGRKKGVQKFVPPSFVKNCEVILEHVDCDLSPSC